MSDSPETPPPPPPPGPGQPPAPGYWMASDGNWYPPESHPGSTTPPPLPGSDVGGSPATPGGFTAPGGAAAPGAFTNPGGPAAPGGQAAPNPSWSAPSDAQPGWSDPSAPVYGAPQNPMAPPPVGATTYQYGQPSQNNGMATAGMVCGILSLLMFWTFGLGVVAGILGIIFGVIGRNKARGLDGEPKIGQAKAGIIMGILGTIGGILFVVVILVLVGDSLDDLDSDPSDGICNPDRFIQDPDC